MSTAGQTTRSPVRSLWILNPRLDLLFFVATPLLILPAFLLAKSRWSIEEIALIVFAFGQIGHQLPGMLRAYGDRALFARHKTRFIIAPLALLAVSGVFVGLNLHGLILISAAWGIWHALMQTYGMLRIYDAKVRSFAKLTQRLDLAMCLTWFGLAVLLSHGRLVMLLDMLFQSGGPLQVAWIIQPLTWVWAAATVAVTMLFFTNLVRSWRAGCPPNPVKLLLLVTSIGFFWFTSVSISNVILGLVMFEVFHDVQYFAIVWVFNRNRAKSERDAGGFTKFLFRRSGALIGIYLGLIFAFGSLHLLQEWTTPGGLKGALTAFLATTGLLHYYYDGFIWKLRDKSTRSSLQISESGSKPVSPAPGRSRNTASHIAKWLLFVVPVCWLFSAERGGVAPKVERYAALREAVPTSPLVRLEFASELHQQGNLDGAAAEYRQVIRLEPLNAKAYNNLGLILVERGEPRAGIEYYRRSLEIDPEQHAAHNNMGNAFAKLGEHMQACRHFREALAIAPRDTSIRNNLALSLCRLGELSKAEDEFRRAIAIAPDAQTHYNFATFFAQQRDLKSAAKHYATALKLDPNHRAARRKLDIIRRINALKLSAASSEKPGT